LCFSTGAQFCDNARPLLGRLSVGMPDHEFPPAKIEENRVT
jgi:hypothetical protein